PVEEVTRRLHHEHCNLGDSVRQAMMEWGIQPYVWSDRLLEFYGETDAFLYETTAWNRMLAKNNMRAWIARHLHAAYPSSARVLTYGDGLGFDSLYLAQAGHRVDYFDVSTHGASFAERMARDYEVDVNILPSVDDVEAGGYDVVVCLDVLEHIPDPHETVAFMSNALRPGGQLVVHAPFWYLRPAVSTHLRSNRKYSGDWKNLYRPHGLRPIDADLFWNPLVLRKTEESASSSPGWRFWLGGALLFAGKYWTTPHAVVCQMMQRREWSSWDELLALVDSLDSS
ncbi:MAG TPA: class I SAM-dependent methyltransferase, partial [Pirellulaceae bacterium]|nr:class I SAM-dependent methyltransferase [Pirellulaceae bacterium]